MCTMMVQGTQMKVTEARMHAADRARAEAKSSFQRRLAERRARLEAREQAGKTGTPHADNSALGLLTTR